MAKSTDLPDLFSQPAAKESSDILASLDVEQMAASRAPDGAVLVRAGAGTGKTRTLVARIVHLVRERNINPRRIAAVTFTSKAAKEIRGRVAEALGERAREIRIGTFHALSLRILSRNPEAAGLQKGFTIVPEDDVPALIAEAIRTGGLSPVASDEVARVAVAELTAKARAQIRSWKASGLTLSMLRAADRPRLAEELEQIAKVYQAYQTELVERNYVDFGDLPLKVVEMLSTHDDLLADEAGRVQHLLVDEAQDANPTQVRWVRLLTSAYRNLFAVGDEDQSIFSFQGGYPGAMIDMAGENAAMFTLTTNRRCTDEILKPAVQLVSWNRRTSQKVLASGVSGPPVDLRIAGSEREEGAHIAQEVKRSLEAGVPASNIAVLARSGWVMRPIEEAMIKAKVEYELVGGISLLERKEALDISAFLRLALNPVDDVAFKRICNTPPRGISPGVEAEIVTISHSKGLPFSEVCSQIVSVDGHKLADKALEEIHRFGYLLNAMRRQFFESDAGVADLVKIIVGDDGLGYKKHLKSGRKDNSKRLENVEIVERLARAHDEQDEADEDDDTNELARFLSNLAMLRDDDNEVRNERKVRVSTMHSSKGLEWDIVFCAGIEVDVVPNRRAVTEMRQGNPADPWIGPSSGGMEEERRLMHVAFTRARKKLYLSTAASRGGKASYPSPFLPESGIDPLDTDPLGHQLAPKGKGRAGRKGYERAG